MAPDPATREDIARYRTEQHTRYQRLMRVAEGYRERAIKGYSESERRRLMDLSDDARARAYHTIA